MERTLLLVDDEENISAALTRLLRRDGYRILRANSGKDGLEMLAQNPVGVIISDQRMPEMTGVEFLSKVKDIYPDTVRIVLSGYTELNSVTDAINRGAIYKFLTKPWEDDLLRANVDEAFRRYEMKMENARLSRELKQANEELSSINQYLEKRVDEKTHEAMRNLGILRISQEVLEHLPVAVIGIGDDGMIAIANRMANELFGAQGAMPLLSEIASERLPVELLTSCQTALQGEKKAYSFPDGRKLYFQCSSMGLMSGAHGLVLVVELENGAA